jgi:hypothetical protein
VTDPRTLQWHLRRIADPDRQPRRGKSYFESQTEAICADPQSHIDALVAAGVLKLSDSQVPGLYEVVSTREERAMSGRENVAETAEVERGKVDVPSVVAGYAVRPWFRRPPPDWLIWAAMGWCTGWAVTSSVRWFRLVEILFVTFFALVIGYREGRSRTIRVLIGTLLQLAKNQPKEQTNGNT